MQFISDLLKLHSRKLINLINEYFRVLGQAKLIFDFTTLYYFVKLFAEFRAQ